MCFHRYYLRKEKMKNEKWKRDTLGVRDFYNIMIFTTVRCVFRLSNNYAEELNKLYINNNS